MFFFLSFVIGRSLLAEELIVNIFFFLRFLNSLKVLLFTIFIQFNVISTFCNDIYVQWQIALVVESINLVLM